MVKTNMRGLSVLAIVVFGSTNMGTNSTHVNSVDESAFLQAELAIHKDVDKNHHVKITPENIQEPTLLQQPQRGTQPTQRPPTPHPTRPGTTRVEQTDIGEIEVQYFGENGPLVVALHGAGQEEVGCWDETGLALAEEGFTVLVPNLYSNEKVIPGYGNAAPDREDYYTLVKNLAKGSKFILLGHSYGGNEAAIIAARDSPSVTRLVLSAPATMPANSIASIARGVTMDLLLCWAEDDPLVPYTNAQYWQETSPGYREIVTVQEGGHAVHEAYIETIVSFASGE